MSLNHHRPASSSLIRSTLASGRRDLWNAQLPFVLSPFRGYLLDPSFLLGMSILPPIGKALRMEKPIAFVLQIFPLGPLRLVLGFFPSQQKDENSTNGFFLRSDSSSATIVPPTDFSSSLRGAFAFVCSASSDLIGALIHPHKMNKWLSSLRSFRAFLHASGVGAELEESIMKPLYNGRLLDNIKIINDIQEVHDADRASRGANNNDEEDGGTTLQNHLDAGKRLMRFATAAYGTEMIRSAIDESATMEELDTEPEAIAFHTQIPVEDVRYIYEPECGGEGSCIRHYLAVDHLHKQVILGIRGTLSISGALVDMQAMGCDFCFGSAHTGMAEIATQLWEESGTRIQQLLNECGPDVYNFIVTGHSLGAGAACLFHLWLYTEQLLPQTNKLCYGFAPPPTFSYHDDRVVACSGSSDSLRAIQQAHDNCICYIHDNDCVPFLSVASIRRLSTLLDTVDNHTEFIYFWNRFLIFWEWIPIPKAIIDAVVEAGVRGSFTKGDLCIPAQTVIWMKKEEKKIIKCESSDESSFFQAYSCSPQAVAARNIFMCNDMISDHLPEMYEDALDSLTTTTKL